MTETSVLARKKRHMRVRRKVIGTSDVPRMSVFRSLYHIYVQLIDDTNGKSLFGCSTLSKRFKEIQGSGEGSAKKNRSNRQSADILGKIIAEVALGKGIKKVVFDRSGYRYHGAVQVLADAARKAGLNF